MVTFYTLGTIVLQRNGRELEAVVASPKRLGLLAYLALARPRGLRRKDEVLALLWPERGQKATRNALRNLLCHIRQELGKDAIINWRSEEVSIGPDRLWVDAVAFEKALDGGTCGRPLPSTGAISSRGSTSPAPLQQVKALEESDMVCP